MIYRVPQTQGNNLYDCPIFDFPKTLYDYKLYIF
jgi:hypothetical protein